MTSIGVHLGNSSACVGVTKNGKVDVVANARGDRLTPAMVTLMPDEMLVGFSSKQSRHRHINQTVCHTNSLLGKRVDEPESPTEIPQTGPTVCTVDGSLGYQVKNGDKSKVYSVKEVVGLILKDALETAQTQAGSDVNEAVFTAPVGFSPSYRDALIDAASTSGFEVLRVISEPAAAALAYGIGIEEQVDDAYFVLVFRVGGVTQDATLLKITNGMVSIQAHISKRCGGDTLTDDIAIHFAEKFEREFKTSIRSNAKAMSKLRTQAENCKHVLSTMPSASCHIDSLYDGMDYNGNISRSRFEMLVSEHLQTLLQPVKEILESTGTNSTDIRKVIMCGGTSNIPRLQEMIARILPESEILSSVPPSEVIAIGAAVESGLLVNLTDPEVSEEDCLLVVSPVDVYLEASESADLCIKSGAVLPQTAEKDYYVPSGQNELVVRLKYKVTSSAQEGTDELVKLTEIALPDLSAGKCVHVQLKYFANGHLVFSCTEKESGVTKSLTVTS